MLFPTVTQIAVNRLQTSDLLIPFLQLFLLDLAQSFKGLNFCPFLIDAASLFIWCFLHGCDLFGKIKQNSIVFILFLLQAPRQFFLFVDYSQLLLIWFLESRPPILHLFSHSLISNGGLIQLVMQQFHLHAFFLYGEFKFWDFGLCLGNEKGLVLGELVQIRDLVRLLAYLVLQLNEIVVKCQWV